MAKGPNARQRLGAQGEAQAAVMLRAAGYLVVACDVRAGRYQVDLLCEEDGDLVFVEVKTRRSQAFGGAIAAITPAKAQHLIAAAETYLASAGTPERSWRIDVVCIDLIAGQPPAITIVRHAVER